jgi:hypothetical protein
MTRGTIVTAEEKRRQLEATLFAEVEEAVQTAGGKLDEAGAARLKAQLQNMRLFDDGDILKALHVNLLFARLARLEALFEVYRGLKLLPPGSGAPYRPKPTLKGGVDE